MTARAPVSPRPLAFAAALSAVVTVAAAWPGVAAYDSVAQFREVVSGAYDDWHPPAMARAWAGLHALVGGGAAPMLVLQVALYWLGLGLIAGGLARGGARRGAIAVLAIGWLPVFWVWQVAVLKDAQMIGAVLAATGIVGWWRLRGDRVPWWGWALAGVCLAYATLVRANAVFAIAPLVAMLAGRTVRGRIAIAVAMVLATLAGMQVVNHRLFGAIDTGVRTTQPRYDLAGIAVRVADPSATRLDAAQAEALRRGHCVKPFFWDPLGDGACAAAEAPLATLSVPELYATLAGAIGRHPVAYAAHRLAHLNATERWWVPAGWLDAWPASVSEPNALGLGDPGIAAARWIDATAPLAETPLAWPFFWLALGIGLVVLAWRRPATPRRDLALALLASALTLEASFAVISIAADLRYHLWPMLAVALAAVLLADRPPRRRGAIALGAVLAVLVTVAIVARVTLPRAPATYQAMLRS